jgi:formate dehydrogenase major subunit
MAANRDLNTGDIGRLYSGRGEVALKVEVTDKVKEGIVFTTFHFPEHMVNMVQVMVKTRKLCVQNIKCLQ